MLGQSDVGHRVVVRRPVRTAPDGRPLFGDLIGDLLEIGEHVVLRTRNGVVHRIRPHDVIAAKRVPPWRPSNRAIRELERAAATGWPAPDTEALGDWLLRAADGFTSRANSALVTGEPGIDRSAAIAAVRDWYRSRGLPAQITTPLPLAANLAGELSAAGWTAGPPVLVQTARLAAVPARPAVAVRLSSEPGSDWLTVAGARRSGLPAAARHVLCAPAEVRFAEVRFADTAPPADEADTAPPADAARPADGHRAARLVGIARGVRTGRWLGISLVEVVPDARRRGYAMALVGALARWAGQAGATDAYLQVQESNQAAVSCYATLGFSTHHTYLTWRA